MLTVHGRITDKDGIHPTTRLGRITANGEPPNATVRISKYDPEAHKFRAVDTLTNCSWSQKGKGKSWVFEGRSSFLEHVVGADDASLVVTLTPAEGDED